MEIAIVGSRDFWPLERVREFVRALSADVTVISGGARGVDTVAVTEARRRGLRVKVIPAQWGEHGRKAGFIRNYDIVRQLTSEGRVVAFWDGKSRGTKHTIEIARKSGIPVTLVRGERGGDEG